MVIVILALAMTCAAESAVGPFIKIDACGQPAREAANELFSALMSSAAYEQKRIIAVAPPGSDLFERGGIPVDTSGQLISRILLWMPECGPLPEPCSRFHSNAILDLGGKYAFRNPGQGKIYLGGAGFYGVCDETTQLIAGNSRQALNAVATEFSKKLSLPEGVSNYITTDKVPHTLVVTLGDKDYDVKSKYPNQIAVAGGQGLGDLAEPLLENLAEGESLVVIGDAQAYFDKFDGDDENSLAFQLYTALNKKSEEDDKVAIQRVQVAGCQGAPGGEESKFLVTVEGEKLYVGENGIYCDYGKMPTSVEILTSAGEDTPVCKDQIKLPNGASGNADKYGLYYEGTGAAGAKVVFVSGFTSCTTSEIVEGGKDSLSGMKKQIVPVCQISKDFKCQAGQGVSPNDAPGGKCACVTFEEVEVEQSPKRVFIDGEWGTVLSEEEAAKLLAKLPDNSEQLKDYCTREEGESDQTWGERAKSCWAGARECMQRAGDWIDETSAYAGDYYAEQWGKNENPIWAVPAVASYACRDLMATVCEPADWADSALILNDKDASKLTKSCVVVAGVLPLVPGSLGKTVAKALGSNGDELLEAGAKNVDELLDAIPPSTADSLVEGIDGDALDFMETAGKAGLDDEVTNLMEAAKGSGTEEDLLDLMRTAKQEGTEDELLQVIVTAEETNTEQNLLAMMKAADKQGIDFAAVMRAADAEGITPLDYLSSAPNSQTPEGMLDSLMQEAGLERPDVLRNYDQGLDEEFVRSVVETVNNRDSRITQATILDVMESAQKAGKEATPDQIIKAAQIAQNRGLDAGEVYDALDVMSTYYPLLDEEYVLSAMEAASDIEGKRVNADAFAKAIAEAQIAGAAAGRDMSKVSPEEIVSELLDVQKTNGASSIFETGSVNARPDAGLSAVPDPQISQSIDDITTAGRKAADGRVSSAATAIDAPSGSLEAAMDDFADLSSVEIPSSSGSYRKTYIIGENVDRESLPASLARSNMPADKPVAVKVIRSDPEGFLTKNPGIEREGTGLLQEELIHVDAYAEADAMRTMNDALGENVFPEVYDIVDYEIAPSGGRVVSSSRYTSAGELYSVGGATVEEVITETGMSTFNTQLNRYMKSSEYSANAEALFNGINKQIAETQVEWATKFKDSGYLWKDAHVNNLAVGLMYNGESITLDQVMQYGVDPDKVTTYLRAYELGGAKFMGAGKGGLTYISKLTKSY